MQEVLCQLQENSYVEEGGQFVREEELDCEVDSEVLASLNEQLGVQLVLQYNSLHQKRGHHLPVQHKDLDTLINKFPFMLKVAS